MDAGSREEFLLRILELSAGERATRVYFANVHMASVALDDPSFRGAMERADLVCPDGMPLVRLLRGAGVRTERFEGMGAFPALLGMAAARRVPVALFGSVPEVLQAVSDRIRRDHPDLPLVLASSPPFGADLDARMADDLRALSASGARLVFVALGCPLQERWIARAEGVDACFLGVGNAFEVHAGFRRRAPAWARSACLEWLFRMVDEPRRLGPRYARSGARFARALPAWLAKAVRSRISSSSSP